MNKDGENYIHKDENYDEEGGQSGWVMAHHERLVRDAKIAIRAVTDDVCVPLDQIFDSLGELIYEIQNRFEELEKDEERFGEV